MNQFSPNLNISKQFAIKHVSSLSSTKKIFNDAKSLSKEELQEYSLLYLIINNLDFFRENKNLLEDIDFITTEGKKIFSDIRGFIESSAEISYNDIPVDSNYILKINKFASIKHISNKIKKDPNKLIEIFHEMEKDLKNLSIQMRINDLESKFSKDLNENTFNEIKELKKLQNTN